MIEAEGQDFGNWIGNNDTECMNNKMCGHNSFACKKTTNHYYAGLFPAGASEKRGRLEVLLKHKITRPQFLRKKCLATVT